MPEAKTSRSAIASLVCGILGFTCLPVIPAIILGIVALVKINKSQGTLKGAGLAIAGLVLSGLGLIFWFVFAPIIAAIAIPNPLNTRIAASELRIQVNLKKIVSAEEMWRQNDFDGNGQHDYWTYDVSCLYRMMADNQQPLALIDQDSAQADLQPAATDTFGPNRLEKLVTSTGKEKFGYFLKAITYDENNMAYNQNEVNGIKATNNYKYAFCACPADYPYSGRKTYIINEEGMIYSQDLSHGNGIDTWPADLGPEGWKPENTFGLYDE